MNVKHCYARLGNKGKYILTTIPLHSQVQLMIISAGCIFLDFVFDIFGPNFGIFHFRMQKADVFYAQVEKVRQTELTIKEFPRNSTLWLQINAQLFFTGFSILLLIDIPCSFFRMSRSPVIAEILVHGTYFSIKKGYFYKAYLSKS